MNGIVKRSTILVLIKAIDPCQLSSALNLTNDRYWRKAIKWESPFYLFK